jgi:hypothetical protein
MLCKKCKTDKKDSLFFGERSGRKYSTCYDCRKKKREEYVQENRDIVLRCTRNNNIKRRHGISLDDYLRLLSAQGNVCAICGKTLTFGRAVHLDHCHLTGKKRGVLCFNCNTGIGHFNDSAELIYKAYQYLTHHTGPSLEMKVLQGD